MASEKRPPGPIGADAAWAAVAATLRAGPSAPEPDTALLAAWLEGRLDEAAAAPLEAWIAREPAAAAERLAALRAAQAAEPAAVPLRLQLRLRAMGPPAGAPLGRSAPIRRFFAQAAGMAAAVVLGVFGAYGGYALGQSGARAMERAETLIAETARADLGLIEPDLFLD